MDNSNTQVFFLNISKNKKIIKNEVNNKFKFFLTFN